MEIGLHVSGANGRALRIEKNRHGSAGLLGERADARHNFAHGAMLGMAHVQSANVRPIFDQLPQYLSVLRCRAEGADDLGLAHRSDD
jgi:hypothetical protein